MGNGGKEWFEIMKAKKLLTILSVVAIVASISTMGASAATGNGGTASPNAIVNYGTYQDSWSNYYFEAYASGGQSETYVKNTAKTNTKSTKVVVEVSRWDRNFNYLYDEQYKQGNIAGGQSIKTSATQEVVGTYTYMHTADIYGSTTSNVVVHSFYYDIRA